MKITRERTSRLWRLYAGDVLLYEGYRSPWDSPQLMEAALRRAQQLPQSEQRAAQPH